MRLCVFIEANIDAIVDDWVEFARSTDVGKRMDEKALRNHSVQILRATVADMQSIQSEREREIKGKGHKPAGPGTAALDAASTGHAENRLSWGFDLVDVVAEYRALRASVLRIWARSRPAADPNDIDDITRFNEAIDQSLCQTVRGFSRGLEQARDTFVGMLGHDLRNPLSAISVSSHVIRRVSPDSDDGRRYLEVIGNAVREMNLMIGDLLDFTRSRLGEGIPIACQSVDLGRLGQELVAQFRVGQPACAFAMYVRGDPAGEWDAARLRQAIANLLGNACRHGAPGGPVTLGIDGRHASQMIVSVHNDGRPIPADDLSRIFNPMTRGVPQGEDAAAPTRGVGLGLFIVREVARAHGGTVEVTSDAESGTTFTIRIPRRAAS